jgi:hypothetical protein
MTEKIKPAARRAAKSIRVELEGDFAGWYAECRSAKDLPARIYGELAAVAEADAQAIVKLAEVLDKIVTSHNLPNAETGALAESMLDVTPDALAALSEAWSRAAFASDPS